MDRGAWRAAVLGVTQSEMTEVTQPSTVALQCSKFLLASRRISHTYPSVPPLSDFIPVRAPQCMQSSLAVQFVVTSYLCIISIICMCPSQSVSSCHHSLSLLVFSGRELGQTPGDGSEGQGGLACCGLWGCKELARDRQQQPSIPLFFMSVSLFCK